MKSTGKVWFHRQIGLFCAILILLASYAPATTLTILNGDFESGSASWTTSGQVYFLPGEGSYNESGTIVGQAASIKSTGSSSVSQQLSGVYADSYDIYKIDFDLGYRCDVARGDDIDSFRVYLWDSTTASEVAGEDIVIGQPLVDESQSPNVDTIVSRRIILKVDRTIQPHNNLLLCFKNNHSEATPSDATAVLDNVAVYAYRNIARWNFQNDLYDETADHDASPLGASVTYGTGILGKKALSLGGTKIGAYAPYASALNYGNFTISAWAKVTGGSGTYRAVVSSRDTSPRSGFTIYANTSNKWSFWTGSSLEWDQLDGPSITNNIWYHLVATFDQTGIYGSELVGTKRLYVNGNLVATKTGVRYENDVDSNIRFYLGAGSNELYPSYSYLFYGLTDDVRYYNTRLTSAEVADIYGQIKDAEVTDNTNTYFSVMTYNIHHGEGRDGDYDLSRAADIINLYAVDIVCLQEVCDGKYGHYNQTETLASYTDMPYYAFGPASYDDTFGNAIISKYPILTVNNYALPQEASEETRAMLVATILIEGRVYTVVCTHVAPETAEVKLLQADNIINTLNYSKGQKILAGDLNSKGYQPPIDHLKQTFIDTYDRALYYNRQEADQIDYVMVSHDFYDEVYYAATLIGTATYWASDHYPVVGYFQLLP